MTMAVATPPVPSVSSYRKYAKETKDPQHLSFVVEKRIQLLLDFDLAVALGDYLLDYMPDNKALVALGHQLQKLSPPDED
jgi:hypothetical protein